MIVKYANTFKAATTGEFVYDDMYVDHATRRVWNVQDWGGRPHLAMEITREHAAKWISNRHQRKLSGVLDRFSRITDRYTPITVPHLPVGEYAEADKIVLHGDNMIGYGYKSGETADGSLWSEMRLDCGTYDDFHTGHCDEHDDENKLSDVCQACGHYSTEHAASIGPCTEDGGGIREDACDCSGFVEEECEDCRQESLCEMGYCKCAEKLEQCSICNRNLGDGDNVWLCMDGGGFACDQHIVTDERPDELFVRVGAIRGEALPAFAWPGGYLIVYLTHDNLAICADCANELDTSDPAVIADIDEEMICDNCPHAQSEHQSGLIMPDGTTADVSECQAQTVMETDTGAERIVGCGCERYYPPLCESCSKPLDPALREWWASLNKKEVTA